MNYTLKLAETTDMAGILQLYAESYSGTYPDQTFRDVNSLKDAIELHDTKYIFVAHGEAGTVIACLLFFYDIENQLSKAGAAVVAPGRRGDNLTQKLLDYGLEYLNCLDQNGIDVLYVTTRTVHKAAQVLTQKMGFKQLGIFPNVHKTEDYETHALAAIYYQDSLLQRYGEFKQHPSILPLFNIARENIAMPEMESTNVWKKKEYSGEVPTLEIIEAPAFIQKRMEILVKENKVDLAFFPFHRPTVLITSPGQEIEVFAYVNEADKHCVITGCKIDREVSFQDLFLRVGNLLRDRGVRYIEVIIRANRLNIIDKILKAKFIPCGYVPAFQKEGDLRYDYVVFSRSFEILDFNSLELVGASQKYLENYILLWKKSFLGDFFNENFKS